jgi:hypothetical protein
MWCRFIKTAVYIIQMSKKCDDCEDRDHSRTKQISRLMLKEFKKIRRRLDELDEQVKKCCSDTPSRDMIRFYYTFTVTNSSTRPDTQVSLINGANIVATMTISGSGNGVLFVERSFPVRENDIPNILQVVSGSLVETVVIDNLLPYNFQITVLEEQITIVQSS